MTIYYKHGLTLLDPPRGEEYWIAADSRFAHAVDLVNYIRASPKYAQHFCIGIAGSCSLYVCF